LEAIPQNIIVFFPSALDCTLPKVDENLRFTLRIGNEISLELRLEGLIIHSGGRGYGHYEYLKRMKSNSNARRSEWVRISDDHYDSIADIQNLLATRRYKPTTLLYSVNIN
jgi:hypothetical protein